jgi:hypothetical protein
MRPFVQWPSACDFPTTIGSSDEMTPRLGKVFGKSEVHRYYYDWFVVSVVLTFRSFHDCLFAVYLD